MAHLVTRYLLALALVNVVSWLLVLFFFPFGINPPPPPTPPHPYNLLERNASDKHGSCLMFQVLSSGVFELKIHSYHTAQRICRRHRDCHIFFRICLKHPEDVISAEPPCTFGTGQTNVIRADHTSISSSAPIRVPFHFKWPVSQRHTKPRAVEHRFTFRE